MSNISNLAKIYEKNVKLGKNIVIEPFCVIKDNVTIGDNCVIKTHAVIEENTVIGKNCTIHSGAVIGNIPQDLKFKGEETYTYIGDNNTIREFVTINRGTAASGSTRIGSNILIMAYAHIAHDCVIKDHCILANGVTLAGHVLVEEYAIIGGLTPVHQFCCIGKHSIVGGNSGVRKDILPYVSAAGFPCEVHGLNLIGLKRRNFSSNTISILKKVYQIIFRSGLNVTQAVEKIKKDIPDTPEVNTIIKFINSSERGICR